MSINSVVKMNNRIYIYIYIYIYHTDMVSIFATIHFVKLS